MPRLSFSQASTFTECEQKWLYRYRHDLKGPATKAMNLGSLVTAACDALYKNESAAVVIEETAIALGIWDTPNTKDLVLDVAWLVGRYAEHYCAEIESVQEYRDEVALEFAHEGWIIECRIDGLKTDAEGRQWLVERKTSARPSDVLSIAPWSPQVTLYDIAARANGITPYGVEYDVLNTYRWKQPRAVADSFDRLHLDVGQEQRDAALLWLDSIILRIEDVDAGSPPIRNVRRDCTWCPYKGPCLEGVAFGDQGITLTDG